MIDARDEQMGAWFEARIVKISPMNNNNPSIELASKQTDDALQQQQSSSGDRTNNVSEADTVGTSNVSEADIVGTSNVSEADTVSSDSSGVGNSSVTNVDDGFLYSIVFERSACAR